VVICDPETRSDVALAYISAIMSPEE